MTDSKTKVPLWPCQDRPGQNGTCVLMSMEVMDNVMCHPECTVITNLVIKQGYTKTDTVHKTSVTITDIHCTFPIFLSSFDPYLPVLQQSLKFLRPAGARRPHLVPPPVRVALAARWRRPREALGRHPPHDGLPPLQLRQHRLRVHRGGGGLLQRGAQQVLELREGSGGERGRGVCRRPLIKKLHKIGFTGLPSYCSD